VVCGFFSSAAANQDCPRCSFAATRDAIVVALACNSGADQKAGAFMKQQMEERKSLFVVFPPEATEEGLLTSRRGRREYLVRRDCEQVSERGPFQLHLVDAGI
jgi:hypothetical protein